MIIDLILGGAALFVAGLYAGRAWYRWTWYPVWPEVLVSVITAAFGAWMLVMAGLE